MRTIRIEGADQKPLTAPADWNEEKDGHCGALFVRREVLDGVHFMRSGWEADPRECAYLFAGAQLTLGISGHQHPVVHLEVGKLPDEFDTVVLARQITKPSGPHVRVEMVFPYGAGSRAYAEVPINPDLGTAVATGIAMIEALARKQGWQK